MITSQQASQQTQAGWQQKLAQSITQADKLLEILDLPAQLLEPANLAARQFPLRVTQHYLNLIEPGNPDDPLLRQILPLHAELISVPDYQTDPVGDAAASLGSGLLQKYQGRTLVITTGACAIHCRYCFRRHYPYTHNNALRHWQNMLQTLRQRTDISEVILSGGDPLSLSDQRLTELIQQITAMPHIQRLRLHSRLPVVLPERVNAALTDCLAATRLHTSLVLHCNHPNELSTALKSRLDKLRAVGVILLNQSVLLAGVNDCAATLKRLSEDLFAHGILPYYLHLLDPVQGAAHFAVPDDQIARLQSALSAQLPGYLVPRIVQEVPGADAKTPWREPDYSPSTSTPGI